MVKNPTAHVGDAGDVGLIPGLGRSFRGGNGNPLQYSCLEKSMDRGAWRATVHRVAKEVDTTEHEACPVWYQSHITHKCCLSFNIFLEISLGIKVQARQGPRGSHFIPSHASAVNGLCLE